MTEFCNAKRIVLKIGTSSLTYETGRFNLNRIEKLVRVLSDLRNSGREVVLVSSGAVTAGISKLGLNHRPKSLREKQATAAVGQCELMRLYDNYFDMYGHTVGQVLLTGETIRREKARINAENTFSMLLSYGCIPIVNENDTVSSEELEAIATFGDNDRLSAYVAVLCRADVLVILSDIDGLYDSDPRKNPDAKIIHEVEKIDEKILSFGGGAGSERGTGGVAAKLEAAKITCTNGITTYLLSGEDPGILYELDEGKCPGTVFKTYDA